MLIICPNCQEETSAKYGFCDSCGEEIKNTEDEDVDLDVFDEEDEEDLILEEVND